MKQKEDLQVLGAQAKIDVAFHEDDRAQRLLDVFPLDKGQINISYINSTEPIVAWHKHKHQTDYWLCIKGSLKVGLATEENGCEFKYLSDKELKILEIPPGVYHGYQALEPNTILVYYVTKKYDPTDEYRVPVGHFDENWEIENK